MPVFAERLPGEPIIIVKYPTAAISPEELALETSRQITALMKDIEGPVYRVNDVREFKFSFSEMMVGIAEETKRGLPGTLGDPRIRVVTVGSHELVKFANEALAQDQYGGIQVSLFPSMEEALAYVRGEIARNK